MNPLDLAQPAFQRLRAYDPGHDLVALRHAVAPDRLVELGSNENPYGPAPGVRLAIDAVLSEVNRYPDPFGGDLEAYRETLVELQGEIRRVFDRLTARPGQPAG